MKTHLSTLVLACLALLPIFSASAADAIQRPNIVFILADDLGYGDLGCYGQKIIQTPNLDRMAADGMRFTQFYAGSTVCAPSRCVLMTGKHTGHATVRGNGPSRDLPLLAADITVAQVLRGAGYSTGLVGKWGLGMPGSDGVPNKQGFDYFFGFLTQTHAHNYYPDYLWRNAERVPLPNVVMPVGTAEGGYAMKRVQYAGDLLADEALAFIEKNKDRPFFLYLAPTAPHANNERARELGDGQEVPDYGPYADKDWSAPNKGQAALITRLDGQAGRLFAQLRQLGLDEQTLVLFSSDNGPHKGEGKNDPEFFNARGPLTGFKRSLTEGGIRVPFLARWPGKIKPGSVSAHVGYFGDMMATFAELASATLPKDLDSLSIVPTLLGRATQQAKHEYLYWEFYEGGSSQAVLLNGRWKGIRLRRTIAPIQLFDLANDLAEQTDVAAKYPDLVGRIGAIMRRAHVDNEDWKFVVGGP
ncbi:MAG: arylsulfatase [Acidobacteria bacterium]|nr:arylsulfatase [Acidobacteriota bacterium]MCI0722769.1 arylsulfatase [Acidobacteriota bacterium]